MSTSSKIPNKCLNIFTKKYWIFFAVSYTWLVCLMKYNCVTITKKFNKTSILTFKLNNFDTVSSKLFWILSTFSKYSHTILRVEPICNYIKFKDLAEDLTHYASHGSVVHETIKFVVSALFLSCKQLSLALINVLRLHITNYKLL